MADNIQLNAGTGGSVLATDELAGAVQVQRVKAGWGPDGILNDVDVASGKPMPVQLRSSSGTELATSGAPLRTDPVGTTAQPITDNSGSITTDSPQLPAALGQAAMAASLPVVIASNQSAVPVSAASLPLPSGAATETTLAALNTKTATAKTSDYDTGAGTDTVPMAGIALPASGGAVAGGTATNPLRTDPTGTTAQPVTDGGGNLSVDDGAGSLTVDAPVGAPVFVRLSDGAAAISTLPVSLASVPSHAVTNAGTFATQESGAALTSLQLIDDVVKLEDAVASSGDAGIPALAVRRDSASAGAADGDYVNLSVDSTGALRVTGGGGGTQYAEDAAHSSGDSGTLSLAVRRDANTSLVDATGDYAPLQVDASGSLKVAIISGAGSGGTSATDDAAFSVASGSGTPIMGLADETSPDSVDEGDVGVVRMTLARALHVNLRDASGNELASGAQYAEDAAHTTGDLGTVALVRRSDTAASSAGTDGDYATMNTDASGRLWVNASGAAVPVTDNSGSLTVDSAQLPASLGQKAMNASLPVTLASDQSTLAVSLASVPSHAVTNVGTFAVQDSQKVADNAAFTDGTTPVNPAGYIFDETAGTALTENDIGAARMDSKRAQVLVLEDATTRGQRQAVNAGGAAEVHGDGAHGASVVGNPLLQGLEARTSDGTAVTNGQAVRAIADTLGKQVVLGGAVNDLQLRGTTNYTNTTAADVIAAQASGVRIAITGVKVVNAHATVGTKVELRRGTTVLDQAWAAANGGGWAWSSGLGPPLYITNAAEAFTARCVTTGADVDVTAVGYQYHP